MEARKLNRVVIKEEIFSLTKDTFEAIILGQLIYWQERVKDFDEFLIEESERKKSNGEEDINIVLQNGWIYKSSKQLIEECMLTISEVTARRYLQNLIDKGFVECRKNPINKWDKKLQYRVNISFVIKEIQKLGYDGLSEYSISKQKIEASNLQNEESILQNEAAIADTIDKDYKLKTKKHKEDTKVSKKAKTNWRADIEVYRKACDDAFNILADDKECEANLIKLYPNIDYYRTIKKSLIFWESEKGWEYKKKSKSVNIDMVSTLKKNLDKSIVYKNVNDKPIQNERLLHIRFADKEEGTLVDGTIFKGGYRYYYSQKDNRSYSIPVDAIERPDDRYEWDNKKGWYLPDDKICLEDELW